MVWKKGGENMKTRLIIALFLAASMLLGVTSLANEQPVRISLDEWIGWQSLLDANGGLITTPNSINAKNGLNIEYVVINDSNASAMSLINGTLAGAGYTINRYAFLQDRFDNAGVKVVMPFITNYSNGGDGIIADASIKSVKDLVGKRIAVARFSEAHTLVEYLLKTQGFSSEEQIKIRSLMVYTETADAAAEAFFSGSVDAAATWEPYLSQAKNSTNASVLFDTSMSTNLILDGIVFRQDFLDKNPDFVTKLIDGALEASSMYKKEFANIKAFSGFEFMLDEEIVDMANGANLATWIDNVNLLEGTAISVYKDMANIWIDLDEIAHPDKAETAFTSLYLTPLKEKYENVVPNDPSKFTDEARKLTMEAGNEEALLQFQLDIKFELNSTVIKQESYDALNEFVEVAKVLNGVYIQIEGNASTRARGVSDAQIEQFSHERAQSVARYFIDEGIEPDRIIVVGRGDWNPIASAMTEEGRAQNRRTDIFFKVVIGY